MKLRRSKPADDAARDPMAEPYEADDDERFIDPIATTDRRGRLVEPEEIEMPPLPSEPLPVPPSLGGAGDADRGPLTSSPRGRKPREKAGPPPWRLDTDAGSLIPRTSLDVLIDVNEKVLSGQLAEYEPVPLGLPPIDRTIGGGLKPGELLLIGGAQGTGKTTMALQMARNIAASGQAYVLYVCFEHDEADLLNRLISMESLLPRLPHRAGSVKIQDVRAEVLATYANAADGMVDVAANPKLRPSLERLARYGHNLFLMRGSATSTTVDNLR
jgi:hypothetical protein